jgi:hypothetical protein
MMRRLALAALALVLWSSGALAQSSCTIGGINIFAPGVIPTPGQWAQCLESKQDFLGSSALAVTNVFGTAPITVNVAGTIVTIGISNGVSVVNPGTGTLETVFPIQTVAGASKTFATADLFKETRRSNSGSAMTDTFPAATVTGIVSGTRITVTNVDATATDTITAGSGTTISGNATYAVGPGRAVQFAYDLANTEWRPTLNTGDALLGPNNLNDVSNRATALANLMPTPTRAGDIPIWTGTTWGTVPGNNSGNQCLGENSSGAGSFTTCGGGGGGGGTVNSGTGGQIAFYATTGTAVSGSSSIPASLTWPAPGTIGGTTPGAASFSLLTLSGITGLTQCLQASSAGVVTGFGALCGGNFVAPGTGGVTQTFQARGQNVVYPTDYCASGSDETTTATINIGVSTTAVTLASAIDFSSTCPQGVIIYGAGPAITIGTPSGLMGSFTGTPGSTTREYFIAQLDFACGITSSSSATVSSTNANLGFTTNSFVTLNWTNGSGSPATTAIWSEINPGTSVTGTTSGGTLTVSAVGAGTVAVGQFLSGGGQRFQVTAFGTGTGGTGTYSISYGGSLGSSTFTATDALIAITNNSTWRDGGYVQSVTTSQPSCIPVSHPTVAVPDWLITYITAGGGTTSISINDAASTSVTNALIQHDDTRALNRAVTYAQALPAGGTLQFPCGFFNNSSAVTVNTGQTTLRGNGQCSVLQQFGIDPAYVFQGVNNSNFISLMQFSDFYIPAYNVYGNNPSVVVEYVQQFISQNVNINSPWGGFDFYDVNSVWMTNVTVNRFWGNGAYGIGLFSGTAAADYSCCFEFFNVQSIGNTHFGQTTGGVGTDKICIEINGNVATLDFFTVQPIECEGAALSMYSNANASPPLFLAAIDLACEFPNSRCVDVGNGGGSDPNPAEIYFVAPQLHGARDNDAVFGVGSNVIAFLGGRISGAACNGINASGISQMSVVGTIFENNSTPASGGTTQTCSGLAFSNNAANFAVSAVVSGDSGNTQGCGFYLDSTTNHFNVSGVANAAWNGTSLCLGGATSASRIASVAN